MVAWRESLYKGDADEEAVKHSAAMLRDLERRLDAAALAELEGGTIR